MDVSVQNNPILSHTDAKSHFLSKPSRSYTEINEKASLYKKLHFATVCRLCTSLYYFLILLKNFFQYPLSTEKTYEGIYFQKVTMWKLQLVKKKKKSEILL